ncbi:MAG TPA: hypothetical protein VIK60_10560 [Vicinamibacterales bacterium]
MFLLRFSGCSLGRPPTPGQKTLYQNMLKLTAAQEVNARAALQASFKLDVAQHVPIHGRVGTNDEFVRMLTNTARTN